MAGEKTATVHIALHLHLQTSTEKTRSLAQDEVGFKHVPDLGGLGDWVPACCGLIAGRQRITHNGQLPGMPNAKDLCHQLKGFYLLHPLHNLCTLCALGQFSQSSVGFTLAVVPKQVQRSGSAPATWLTTRCM